MFDDVYDDRITNFDFEWDEKLWEEYHNNIPQERRWEPVYPDYTEDDNFLMDRYANELYM